MAQAAGIRLQLRLERETALSTPDKRHGPRPPRRTQAFAAKKAGTSARATRRALQALAAQRQLTKVPVTAEPEPPCVRPRYLWDALVNRRLGKNIWETSAEHQKVANQADLLQK